MYHAFSRCDRPVTICSPQIIIKAIDGMDGIPKAKDIKVLWKDVSSIDTAPCLFFACVKDGRGLCCVKQVCKNAHVDEICVCSNSAIVSS